MSTAHKLHVDYNPYLQQIRYKYKKSNHADWERLVDSSKLRDFQQTALLPAVDDIISCIGDCYIIDDDTVEIVFSGTDGDFNILEDAVERYVSMYPEKKKQLSCTKDDVGTYEDAAIVLCKVEEIYSNVQAELVGQDDDKEVCEILSRYTDATKETIPVCVMGLYSSGKSTFINALIGREILPCDADPLTANIVKIKHGEVYSIKYERANAEYEFRFANGKAETLSSAECTTEVSRLLSEINGGIDDDEKAVAAMLKGLNGEAQKIEVTVPFNSTKLPVETTEFEIYDMPGFGATSYEAHAETLKKELSIKSNGIPIVVCTRTCMDLELVTRLTQLIDNLGKSLDANNMIIVINKADEGGLNDLKKFDESNNDLTKRKRHRSIFTSSLIALGSKKKGVLGEEYLEEFSEKSNKFVNVQDQYYRSCPRVNRLPESRRTEILRKAEEAEAQYEKSRADDDKYELMAHNSGIRGVESQIAYYADNLAIYNKCYNARQYLEEAINRRTESAKGKQQELRAETEKLERDLEIKYDALWDRIQKTVRTFEESNQDITEKMKADLRSVEDESQKKIKEEIHRLHNKHRKNVDTLNDKIKELFKDELKALYKVWAEKAKELWENAGKTCRDELLAIISDGKSITSEQRDALKEYVQNSGEMKVDTKPFDLFAKNLASKGGYRIHIGRWRLIKKRDKVEKPDELVEKFMLDLKSDKSSVISEIRSNCEKTAEEWADSVRKGLRNKLITLNETLRQQQAKIDTIKQELGNEETKLRKLEQAKDDIEKICKTKRGGN